MSHVVDVALVVNGKKVRSQVAARRNLADHLRDDLGLTGTHIGCEQGICGACTVLVDGAPIRSCLMLTAQADGREVITVEGLHEASGPAGRLAEVLEDNHVFQCGFCTPGIMVSLAAMLEEVGAPLTEDQLRAGLSGHLCRCTGYQNLIRAMTSVAFASEAVPG